MKQLNICIIKPNKENYSEPFIEAQIQRLPGYKQVLYGGFFPLYEPDGKFLIKGWLNLLWYLFNKRVLKKLEIPVRTQALADYLKKQNIDVVLAEYGPTGALVHEACQKAGVPLVIHYHGFDAHHHESIAKYKALYKRSYQYAHAVVGVSKDMCKALVELGAPEKKVIYNPYGVDLDKFRPVNVVFSELNFLSVARFADKKAPHHTITAFKKVHDQFPKAKLIMAGIGPLWEESKELAVKLGLVDAIVFKGVLSHDEVYDLMKNCRAFVQHSVIAANGDSEGTPNSILEASAAGLPIVSTYHAGIKEAVVHSSTGFLVQEHDVEGMAEFMLKLAEDASLAALMGSNARKHVELNYSFEKRIGSLFKVLTDAVKK